MASYERQRLRVHEDTTGKVSLPTEIILPLSFHHATHVFIGTEFFNNDTKVTPLAGTITYTVETTELPEYYQGFPSNVINADTPSSASVAANVVSVKATFDGVVGANQIKLNVGANIS